MNIKEYLNKFEAVTKDPSLDAMEYFMEEFDNPDKKTKFIHIAGTNGKGSVCEMINNILINAGYKVGKYMSPHLIRYNERITVNNIEITDEEMSEILQEIDAKIDNYNKTHKFPVKQFEIVTTLALVYFARKKCDFVVLETGLGGTYDCTNIADGLISIITSIGYDHMNILGNTIEEITNNKAGIIKKNRDTIMCFQEKITNMISEKCKKENNTLHVVKKEDVTNYSFDNEIQTMDYKGYKNIKVNLKGIVQIYNAAVSIDCMEVLKSKGYSIGEEDIRKGLSTVIHKARFEILENNPRIIFDGGHNEDAIKNLRNTINMYYPEERKIYILSILKTKDYKTVIQLLSQDRNGIFIFTSGNDYEKYVAKEELFTEAKKYLDKNIYKENLEDAIKLARTKYPKDVIMIIGSFYVYSDVLKFLGKE